MDVDGLAWVPTTISIKAQPGNAKSLANSLLTMTTNKNKRTALKKNARPFAKLYGWDNIAKQYESYCNEVVSMDQAAKSQKGGLALSK